MIQTLENFLRPYVEAHPQTWSQSLMLAEFAANNAVNVATGYSPFYLNASDHPLVPSALMHGGCVCNSLEKKRPKCPSIYKSMSPVPPFGDVGAHVQ